MVLVCQEHNKKCQVYRREQASWGHKSTKKKAQHDTFSTCWFGTHVQRFICSAMLLNPYISQTQLTIVAMSVSKSIKQYPVSSIEPRGVQNETRPRDSTTRYLLLMLSISVLPIRVIQQTADSILQLRLLMKDLLQALKCALLACLRCE